MGSTQVPEGYKQTEVGVIPKDWSEVDVEKLKSPSENALATGPFGSSIGSRFFQEFGVPVIRGSNLSQDICVKLNDDGLVFVSFEKAAEFKRSIVRKGDLIFTCWGTINQVGLIDDNANYSEYIISNKQMKFTPDPNKSDSLFLYYLFSGPELQHIIKNQNIGSSVPGFNLGQLRELRFRTPPLPEQRSIAQALSDVDALIASLDKLIAKKRHLKTATMQQLLTGKMRSPGFGKGKWSRHQLGDVVEKIVGGGTPSRANPDFWDGNIPWATVKDFSSFDPFCTQEYITKEGLSNSASNLIPRGTLITSTRMALGKAVIYKVDVAINQDLKAIFPNQNIDCLYLYYWFESQSEYIDSLGGGSTVKGISVVDLKSIWLFKPPLEEQKSIAQVLSDMDTEITALETRRAKTQAIKQGMMQELLTGRTRLI
jgi:type I restriction enzyme, S subunit